MTGGRTRRQNRATSSELGPTLDDAVIQTAPVLACWSPRDVVEGKSRETGNKAPTMRISSSWPDGCVKRYFDYLTC
jgi:hypothetical protein